MTGLRARTSLAHRSHHGQFAKLRLGTSRSRLLAHTLGVLRYRYLLLENRLHARSTSVLASIASLGTLETAHL